MLRGLRSDGRWSKALALRSMRVLAPVRSFLEAGSATQRVTVESRVTPWPGGTASQALERRCSPFPATGGNEPAAHALRSYGLR